MPSKLAWVDSNQFENCTSLNSVIFGADLRSVEREAFSGCTSLQQVELPQNLEAVRERAFGGCMRLQAVKIPSDVNEIADDAFEGSPFLTIYGTDEAYAKQYAAQKGFSYSTGAVVLDVLETMETGGFSYVLRTHNAERSAAITAFDKSKVAAFDGTIVIPASIAKDGQAYSIVAINDKIFYYENESSGEAESCGITKITVNANIRRLPSYFTNSRVLTQITLPDTIEEIAANALNGCRELKYIRICEGSSTDDVELPSHLKKIGESAFRDCNSITSITIPEGVTTLGDNALFGCSGMVSVSLPSSLTNVGSGIFYYCEKLKEVILPASVTQVTDYMFSNCYALEKVILGANVTGIGKMSFENCSSLYQLVLKGDVTKIEERAFEYSGIFRIYIPSGVAQIAEDAFGACDSLAIYGEAGSVAETFATQHGIEFVVETIDENETGFLGQSGDFKFIGFGNKVKVMEYTGNSENVTIPETIEYNGKTLTVTAFDKRTFPNTPMLKSLIINAKVQTIPDLGFAGASNMKSIEIPDSVKRIGRYAFGDCASLENLKLPKSLEIVEWMAFGNCTSLKTVIFPEDSTGIRIMESSVFSGCAALESIQLPAMPKVELGDQAFLNCTSLTIVSIDDGIKKIDFSAFEGCTSLTTVYLPESLEKISNRMFYGCKSLAKINIGSKVTEIGNNAFEGCVKIGHIRLPQTVTTISEDAFHSCTMLTGINIPKNASVYGNNVFTGCPFLVASIVSESNGESYVTSKGIRYITIAENEDGEGITAEIPTDTITDEELNELPIVSDDILAVFDDEAKAEIAKKHGNNKVTFKYNVHGNVSNLLEILKAMLNEVIEEGGKIMDLALVDSGNQKIDYNSDDNDGDVSITVPYEASAETEEVTVYHVADDGTKTDMNGVYDAISKTVTFSTKHFSLFTIEKSAKIAVTGITLDKSTLNIKKGATATLTATIAPADAADKTVTWTSSDDKIATVKDGIVSGVDEGTAVITAAAGKYTATCTVMVGIQRPKDQQEDVSNAYYTVIFNPNKADGGNYMNVQGFGKSEKKKLYANTFTRTGYTFKGWNTKANGKGTAYQNQAKVSKLATKKGRQVTLYAQWAPIKYNIKFNGNGKASGSTAVMKNIAYGKLLKLTANGYKKKGYKFIGWNTSADGEGTVYANKQKVSNLSETNRGTVTLYAQWEIVPYTITYNLKCKNGTTTNPETYTVDTETITLSNPEREGYEFRGWYSNSKYEGKKVTQIKKGSTGNKKLYARWRKL